MGGGGIYIGQIGKGTTYQSGSTGPHLPADDCVVDLFAPEGGFCAEDVGFLLGGEVEGEVEVVDALPRFVGSAPGAAGAEVVEAGRAVAVVGVGLDVVAGVVGDPAAEAAVQVEEV